MTIGQYCNRNVKGFFMWGVLAKIYGLLAKIFRSKKRIYMDKSVAYLGKRWDAMVAVSQEQ